MAAKKEKEKKNGKKKEHFGNYKWDIEMPKITLTRVLQAIDPLFAY